MNPIQQFQQDLINKYYGLIPAWEITNLYTPSDHEIVFSVKTARYEGKIIASYDNGTLITQIGRASCRERVYVLV